MALCSLPRHASAQEQPAASERPQPAPPGDERPEPAPTGDERPEPAPAEGPRAKVAPTSVPPSETTSHVVTLNDGQVLRGRVLKQTPRHVVLVLEDGTPLPLPHNAVRSVEEFDASGGAWGRDPNLTRYLYSPSAFTLGAGNGYLAQRALAITTAGVGVTDFLDLELGTILPLLFTETRVGVAGVKLAAPLGNQLNVGAGAQAFFVEDVVAGFAFANTTVGTHDSHFTIAAGGALEFTEGELGAYVLTVSGSHRLGPGTALITENWLFYLSSGDGPWDGPVFVVPSGGVRLFGPTFAVDLALVPVITLESELPVVPLPWLSFAWNWSLGP